MAVEIRYNELRGNTSAQYIGGSWHELRTTAHVIGLTAKTSDILREAVQAISDDGKTPGSSHPTLSNLYLAEYHPAVDESPDKVVVELVYRQKEGSFARNFRQYYGSGFHNDGSLFTWTGNTTLQSTTTTVDAFGNPLTANIQYSDNAFFGNLLDNVVVPTDVLEPQTTVTGTGVLQLAYPDLTSRFWTGALNADIWAGNAPGTWLCTNVRWEPYDASYTPVLWTFTFEFQYNYRGWQPYAEYRDPQNRVPASSEITSGTLRQRFTWYPSFDFYPYFPI